MEQPAIMYSFCGWNTSPCCDHTNMLQVAIYTQVFKCTIEVHSEFLHSRSILGIVYPDSYLEDTKCKISFCHQRILLLLRCPQKTEIIVNHMNRRISDIKNLQFSAFSFIVSSYRFQLDT
jgi:hypothetical protein